MSKNNEWKHFFGSAYQKFSQYILTEDRTQVEVENIENILNLQTDSNILDLGCGNGRITIPLAQKGYHLTGFDGSNYSLNIARKNAGNLPITWIENQIKDLDSEQKFDAILSIGTAFGYVDEHEDKTTMKKIYDMLNQGGKLLIDTENRDFMLNEYRENAWNEMGDQIVWSKRKFNPMNSRWREVISWNKDNNQESSILDVRIYSAHELITILETIGFKVQKLYGSLKLDDFHIRSSRIVIVAGKG
ncbi:class I SAM-dependent methyltransferase [Chengkuizengella sediminis]|uniref:class I SAM-dependent methyltransferase n=1 Tax=Chengkuizengella sediminis TaxID=1885917 RepID=UPI0013897A32|nr:class I SAM-dependent methyltransferase [Chengkuizengella sediminis]NDI35952.1 class I SAM-dependent methyltransferase [Chengkuizengella sediminis]